jgi:hypothetical protein
VPQLRAGDPYKVDQRLFWHVVDELDYLLALLRLRILDALAGPLPETPADQHHSAGSGAARAGVPRLRSLAPRSPVLPIAFGSKPEPPT